MKISGYMYKFQDLTPISGHFRTNFKISGQRPGLRLTVCCCLMWIVSRCLDLFVRTRYEMRAYIADVYWCCALIMF